jgi:hypothetical protein
MLQLSPCGQSSLLSELLSICKHVLGLRGSVAQASLLGKLGLQPLQIIWLKACVKFFATACSASRGNPLLWEALRANVELCFRTAPLGEESRPTYICVLCCAFHIHWCPAWLGSASVATTWEWNLAGIKEWFGLRVAATDVQLWECTIFLWTTKPICSLRAQLPLWLGGSVDLHNCHLCLCRISCAL